MPKVFAKRPIDSTDPALLRHVLRNPHRLADYVACDFCGDPLPVVVYQAHRMTTGEHVINWRWCACVPCERAIDHNNWGDLKLRVSRRLGMMLPGLPDDVVQYAVNMAFEHFTRDVVVLSPEG